MATPVEVFYFLPPWVFVQPPPHYCIKMSTDKVQYTSVSKPQQTFYISETAQSTTKRKMSQKVYVIECNALLVFNLLTIYFLSVRSGPV